MNIDKPHPNIRFRTMVSVDLSAAQWCLDTEHWSRTITDQVANYLNKRLTFSFNVGDSAEDVTAHYRGLRTQFALYVTKDTDRVFDNLLKVMFTPRHFTNIVSNRARGNK